MKNRPAQLPQPYERNIYQFLSICRFFAFAIAVALIQIVSTIPPTTQIYLILGLLGIYTILKLFSPFRLWQRDLITYLVLGGDFVVCICVALFTGGLSSGFLLYSLIPILTAALLFEEKIALSLAFLSSLSLLVAHLGLSHISDRFAWILQDNNLTLLIIYAIICFIIATMGYRTNLNIRRRVEKDAILEERRRMRREIHDGIAQALGYLNLKTSMVRDSVSSHNMEQALDGLGDIRKVVEDAYEDVRESIDYLTIEATESLPLIPTLAEYVREFRERSGVEVEFDAPKDSLGLSPAAELQLLRIAQEALTNVRKHALASKVGIGLVNTPQYLEMVVKDDGQSFSTSDSQSGYHGLNIMKERAQSIGGELTIAPAPGQGTEIRVRLPWVGVRL